MSRRVELLQHLPEMLQMSRQLQAMATAENPELQGLVDEVARQFNNRFILTCDEEGIGVYERMLGIEAAPGDTLAYRIERVLARWNDMLPYTWRVLLRKLEEVCGAGNFKVTPYFESYRLLVETSLAEPGRIRDLDHLLDYIIPANLKVDAYNQISIDIAGEMYAAAPVFPVTVMGLTDMGWATAEGTLYAAAATGTLSLLGLDHITRIEGTAEIRAGTGLQTVALGRY